MTDSAGEKYTYKNDVVKEIILGCAISPPHKEQILSYSKNFPNAIIYQANKGNFSFSLDFEQIEL